jgi:hypothetical protein
MSANITPRLTTSKTWTELPAEFTKKVNSIFATQFKVEAGYGEFLVEGRIYPDEVVVRIGFVEKGRLKQANFEASMDRIKTPEDKTMDALYSIIDALGGLMEEFFELDGEEELDIPLAWKAFDFEGETIYLQQTTVNSRLEAEADRILGLLEKSLVQEENLSEDALARAEIDSELAEEVQRLIREGKHPMQMHKHEPSEPGDSDLN